MLMYVIEYIGNFLVVSKITSLGLIQNVKYKLKLSTNIAICQIRLAGLLGVILPGKSSVRMRVKDVPKDLVGRTEVTYYANQVDIVAALKCLIFCGGEHIVGVNCTSS